MNSSSREQSESLILGNCLSCQGLVRVPSRAPAESTVRCPHCSESYRLSQILDQAVPVLEIVDSSKSPQDIPRVDKESIKVREVFVVPPQLSKGAIRSGRRRRRSSDSSSESGDSTERISQKSSVESKGKSSSSSSSHSLSSLSLRRPAAKRNPTMEMVKVILGGILAIPIAYLLVLWVFRQDPLNVGPKVGSVVPFMIPASLRVETESEDTDSNVSNIEPGDKEKKRDDDSLVIPKLDPDRILNPELDESK